VIPWALVQEPTPQNGPNPFWVTPERDPDPISVRTLRQVELPLPEPPTRRGGRPEKYRWDEFYAELVVRADLDGLPPTQAELIDAMAKWCQKRWGTEPAVSVLKEKVALIYRHPRKAGN
jgi:hypothetical protein